MVVNSLIQLGSGPSLEHEAVTCRGPLNQNYSVIICSSFCK